MIDTDINLDLQRLGRIGFDEAIFCVGKTIGQLESILNWANGNDKTLLLTRLGGEKLHALPSHHRERIDYETLSQTGIFGAIEVPAGDALVAVVSAGTSDAAVSREAVRTLRYFGHNSFEICDVGVAGLWRILDRVEELRQFPVVITVAGMDAALPSVIGGLLPGVVIAVPTSTGYGIAESGKTALRAALVSCAPGIVVVNIDNGYGAACAAKRILQSYRLAR
jgi:pyridinium-3,5-biscarboxylic acid mononucleotide synthase